MNIESLVMPVLIALVGAVVGAVVATFRRKLPEIQADVIDFSRTHLGPELFFYLESAAAIAVRAVEQEALKENLAAAGEVLLNRAVVKIQRMLDQAGLGVIDVEVLKDAARDALRKGVHKDPPEIEVFELDLATK